ncbi:MAG: RNA methyltransferase [Acidimicrobiales bacterium]
MSRRDLVLGPNNARVRALRRLATQRRDRRVEGVALVEGPTLVAEALSDDRIIGRVREVFTESPLERSAQARADDASIPVTFVEAGVLDKVLDTVTPQPIVAVVETLSASIELLATDRPVLVLVDVRDPGNLGTLIRTAEASGCAGVVLAGTCVDPTNPKVVRASAGSWLRTIVVEDRDIGAVIDGLADQRRPIVAAALVDGARDLWQTDLTRAAILLGNEAHGLPADVIARADTSVVIPFDGPTESLNVGVAGALLAFEALRQRRMV